MAELLRWAFGVALSQAHKPDTKARDSVSNLNTYRCPSCCTRVSTVVGSLLALTLSGGSGLGGNTSSSSVESPWNTVSVAAFTDVTNRTIGVGFAEDVDEISATRCATEKAGAPFCGRPTP